MHAAARAGLALIALACLAALAGAGCLARRTPPVRVTGTVVELDADAARRPKPAAGLDLRFADAAPSSPALARTDSRGRFQVDLPAGQVMHLIVSGPGHVPAVQPALRADRARDGLVLHAVPEHVDWRSDAVMKTLTGILFSQEVGMERDRREGKVLGLVTDAAGAPLIAATVRLESASPLVAERRRAGQMYVAPSGDYAGYRGFFVMLNVPPGPIRLVTSDFPESRSARARYLLSPVDTLSVPGAVSVARMTGTTNPWTGAADEVAAPVRFAAAPWSCGWRHRSRNVDSDASLALGSGVGIDDLDGDGRLDILATGGLGQPNAVLLQRSAGRFEPATGTGLEWPEAEKAAIALGDLDGDGDPDAYQGSFGPDQLFENLGNARFNEVSRPALVSDPSNARTVALTDLDGDGKLDLFCGNYDLGSRIDMDRLDNPGQGNTMHLNLGGMRFREVAPEAGLGRTGLVYAQAFVDLTGDGLDDLVLAHDHGRLRFYVNRSRPGRVRFEDASERAGFTGTGSWMGIAAGDCDGDGDLDLFVTNTGLAEPMYDPVAPESYFLHRLYRNDGLAGGIPRFTDVAVAAGVADAGWGWGCRLEDLDGDGATDLALVNNMFIGAIGATGASQSFLGLAPPGGIGGTEGFVFFGDGAKMRLATRSAGVAVPHDARALSTADLDGDGAPDLIVGTERGPLLTYRNGGAGHAWIALEPRGDGKAVNTSGIGAIVTVRAGPRTLVRARTAGDSFKTSSGPVLTFGLGEHRAPVTATVRWPGGSTTTHPGLAPGRKHVLALDPKVAR